MSHSTRPENDRQGIQADKPAGPEGIQTHRPASPGRIQADKPPPPWEQPGSFRLDCKPHRAGLLVWMAAASVACSAVLLGPFVLPLTLVTWRLARQDLRRMREGTTDPAGEQRTVCAGYLCSVAFLLAGLNTLVLIILFDMGSK